MDILIHTSLSHPATGGSAKWQAVEHGMTTEVHAECSGNDSTHVYGAGVSSTMQNSHESCRELERGARELKEDEETFRAAPRDDNGTPVPFLVNPQTDVPPLFTRQTVKRVINFALDMDTWQDDVASPTKSHLTSGACHRREFQYADGQCTSTDNIPSESTLGTPESAQAAAEPETEEEAQLQWAAKKSRTGKKKKMTSATEQEEEETKKLDEDDAPVTDKDKDKAGGPSAGEGSGLTT